MLSGKFRKACNSFDGDTEVWAEDGIRSIDELLIGDKVWAFNEETQQLELQDIVHLIQREGEYQLVNIALDNGETINTTQLHPLYVMTEKGWEWQDAGELEAGDVLRDREGWERSITNIEEYTFEGKVFNLTVDSQHTYLVGDAGIVAHNTNKECDFEGVVRGAKKLKIIRNPKHNRGGGRKPGKGASAEPSDSFYAYQNSAVKSADDGHWYALSPDKKHIYRYFESNDGTVHWVSSTSQEPKLKAGQIPIKIRRLFEFKSKGK